MKELSIEEKAKRYDEAIERAVKIHRNYKGRVRAVDVVIEEVFPEFKESEDERIRKELIEFVKSRLAGFPQCNKYLAWLEKQGEKKSTIEMITPEESLGIDSDTYNKIVDECIYGEQNLADKVEPKFKVGDWIADKLGNTLYVKEVYDSFSKVIDEQYRTYNYDNQSMNENCHLWTIQDAKDGDVLVHNGCTFIFMGIKDDIVQAIEENILEPVSFGEPNKDKDYHPATKEQREILFQKMKEAGYKWDAEKKELKKIEPKTTAWTPMDEQRVENLLAIIEGHGYPGEVAWLNSLKDRVQLKQDEQKSTWSEEDDKILKSIIINIENLQFSEDMREKYHHIPNANKSYYQIKIDWLKSLKERVQPQKQEWSDVDKEILFRTINNLKFLRDTISIDPKYAINIIDIEREITWLKSLRPQNRWKPSLSQLNALSIVAKGNLPDDIEEIKSLYNDLHKLIN